MAKVKDAWLAQLLDDVRNGRPADVAGSRAALDVSVSERLLNQVASERLPPDGPVAGVQLRILAGAAKATVRMARPRFLPPITVTAMVESQAELPGRPVLVLRLIMPPGLGLLVGFGASLFNALPPGLRLEGDRLHVDLEMLMAQQDLAWALRYASSLLVTFEEGRVRIQGSAAAE